MTQLALPVIWGETNKGIQRGHNEDQIYPDSRHKTSMRPPTPQALAARGTLLIVADGIGGAQVGDTAANFAVRTAVDHYYGDPRQLALDRLLQAAVEMANTSVYNYVSNSPAIQQAGCTMTAAVVHGAELVIAHVGDSRAYLLRKGALYPLTSDHNVAQMLATGQTPPGGQPLAGNVLTRSLGAAPTVAVDVNRFPLEAGDTVMVCSDGLHGVLSDDDIKKVLGRTTPEKAAGKLIDLANAQGGPDNISVVIARLPDAVPAAGAVVGAAGGKSVSNRTALYLVAGMMALAVVLLLGFALSGLIGREPTTPPLVVTTPAITGATSTAPVLAPPMTVEATLEPMNSPAMAGIVASPPPVPTEGTRQPGAMPGSTTTSTRAPTSTPRVVTPTPTPTPAKATPRRGIPDVLNPFQRNGPQTVPVQPQIPSVPLPIPELQEPGDGETRENNVSLNWKSRPLNSQEKFRIWLRSGWDNSILNLESQDFTFPIVFDTYPGFFNQPGDFFWKVQIVDSLGNREGPFSLEWRFRFERKDDDGSQDTPEPVPTAR